MLFHKNRIFNVVSIAPRGVIMGLWHEMMSPSRKIFPQPHILLLACLLDLTWPNINYTNPDS